MSETPKHAYDQNERQDTEMSEVTFHLAPRTESQPFRWVAGITTPDDTWQSRSEANIAEDFEPLTVDLEPQMARSLIDFARKHIGPNATDRQIDYWCHTYAREIGATALSIIPSTVGGGEQGLADAQARGISRHGEAISPSDLAVGEHAVVVDSDPNSPSKAPIHSMVGIGRPKGDDTSTPLAVQVDRKNGDLYVGDPKEYLEDVRASRAPVRPTSQPELYVQRTPLVVSDKSSR